MDTQGGGRGGEVRRLHIIYFLCRNGRIEHPHLLRVRQLSRSGVRLRDVKRWLSELRGKDMPESFVWSFKRRYKNGYVWQDLLDEDLVTPISDNEYILKGSEIPSMISVHNNNNAAAAEHEDTAYSDVEGKEQKSSSSEDVSQARTEDSIMNVSPTKASPLHAEMNEKASSLPPLPLFGSDEKSTLTDDSAKDEEQEEEEDAIEEKEEEEEKEKNSDNKANKEVNQKQSGCRMENNPSFYSALFLNRKKKKKKKTQTRSEASSTNADKVSTPDSSSSSPSSSSSSSSSFNKRTSYYSTTSMFRNLITCGAVDANESSMIMINRSNKCPVTNMPIFSRNTSSTTITTTNNNDSNTATICRGDRFGGSERICGNPPRWDYRLQEIIGRKSFDGGKISSARGGGGRKSESDNNNHLKKTSSAFKPLNGPICSQCGKPFKPEKLHAHMKSCKGNMKASAKGGGASSASTTRDDKVTAPRRSTDYYSANHTIIDSAISAGYYLTG